MGAQSEDQMDPPPPPPLSPPSCFKTRVTGEGGEAEAPTLHACAARWFLLTTAKCYGKWCKLFRVSW